MTDWDEGFAPGGYPRAPESSADATRSAPSDDRYPLAANKPLRAALGETVVRYNEPIRERPDDRRRATARLLARRSTGGRQSYPSRPEAGLVDD